MSKVMTMKEAISKYVKSGDLLFLSGAQHGEPSAAIHEIVRQKIDHLTVVCCLVTTIPLLIGEGLVDRYVAGWAMQDKKRAYVYQKAASLGRLPEVLEYSHFGLSMALMAGMIGVPFMPTRCMIGSDILKYNKDIAEIDCPFTGVNTGLVKAIVPDVGIIHVQRADALGNCQKFGSLGMDVEGINGSKTVIVTTEKIVDSDVIRRDPNRTIIPGFRVSAVVEAPWGAYPMHLGGCYNSDQFGFMFETARKETYEPYVEKLIYGTRDWAEYLKVRREMKGEEYWQKLEIKNPVASDPIPSGY